MKTIDQITDEFYNSIDDIKAFEIFGVNIIKMCYHSYSNQQVSLKNYTPSKINKQKLRNKYILFFKQIIQFIKWRLSKKIMFFGAGGRTVKTNNKEYNIYNYNIINYFTKKDILYIEGGYQEKTNKIYFPDCYITDLTIPEKLSKIKYFVRKENTMLKQNIL